MRVEASFPPRWAKAFSIDSNQYREIVVFPSPAGVRVT